MRIHLDGETYNRRAVDLSRHDLEPRTVAAAVRDDTTAQSPVQVECPTPGPVHERVAVIEPGMTIDRRGALAAAARSRGASAPQDDQIATVERELASMDPPPAGTQSARRRLAEAGAEQERLRERVARLQGRVRARREAGLDTADVEATLSEAVGALSEVETERVAARQALADAREAARDARDVRERRLRLEDRLGNLRRAARADLAATVREEVGAAVRAAPGEATDLEGATPATVALGVVRVAAVRAPVVLVDHPFDGVDAAESWLDAPVVEV